MINKFKNKYAFLSNFYESPLYYQGLMFKNAEAAFQAQKESDISKKMAYCHFSAQDAKNAGRQAQLPYIWENIKLSIMFDVILAKFSQNADLKSMLLETGNEELVEGNTWGDMFWGKVNGEGENHLGKTLMNVRTVLRIAELLSEKNAKGYGYGK
jgi:hypothetical protein